ncbi:hypothetical protein L915_13159, partial [Phytophthora nicotianae]
MAPDVLSNTSSGVDTLVTNWYLFTQWFPAVRMELKQVKRTAERSFIAFSTTSFTISALTMQI